MKHLPIGHGRILWGLDEVMRLRYLIDLEGRWEPLEGEDSCRIGLQLDGRILWADRDGEVETEALDGLQAVRTVVRFPDTGLEMAVTAYSLRSLPCMVRRIEVLTDSEEPVSVKVILSEGIRDTGNPRAGEAYFDPQIGGVVHHRGSRFLGWFLRGPEGEGPDGYSLWSLAESRRKGPRLAARHLDGVGMASGSAGSAMSLELEIPPGDSRMCHQWILLGSSYNELCRSHERLFLEGAERLVADAGRHTRLWLQGLADEVAVLPRELLRLYRRSLLILACHTSISGAVVEGVTMGGAPELGVVHPGRAALVAEALAKSGDARTPGRILRWLANVVEPEGFFLPMYLPDGSWASCAIPWVEGEVFRPPFSGTATAVFLWAAARVVRKTRDVELAMELPRTVARPMLALLLSHRNDETGLPRPAVGPWGEQVAISTYGCAATYAGLQAGADLLRNAGDDGLGEEVTQAAVLLREGLVEHMYDPKKGRFPGSAVLQGDRLVPDPAVDASAAAFVLFDVLAAKNPIVESTMRAVRDKLWVPGKPGGLALRSSGKRGERLEPNPTCTLWLARWTAARAKSQKQLTGALDLLRWSALVAGSEGSLPARVDPVSGENLGEMPSIWAHAEFISAVQDVVRRMNHR